MHEQGMWHYCCPYDPDSNKCALLIKHRSHGMDQYGRYIRPCYYHLIKESQAYDAYKYDKCLLKHPEFFSCQKKYQQNICNCNVCPPQQGYPEKQVQRHDNAKELCKVSS